MEGKIDWIFGVHTWKLVWLFSAFIENIASLLDYGSSRIFVVGFLM